MSPRACLALYLLCLLVPVGQAESEALLADGQRIYREGVLPSGEPMEAVTHGGARLSGRQAACATCHRRSGLGSSEGGKGILPVAGRMLFSERDARHRERYQQGSSGVWQRPAYTQESLAHALRQGEDPTGRLLHDPMPRYKFSDGDVAALAAYLKTLSATPSPGVSATTVRIATVVTDGVDPSRRDAMLQVLQSYVAAKNAGTRGETLRAKHAPWTKDRMYPAYRQWALDVWRLTGPESTWNEQLERHYRAQPVFALVSGMSSGGWRPVHEFCERLEVPCLFPMVDLPVVKEGDFYTMYFSKGVILEAQALAKYLAAELAPTDSIVQVFSDDATATEPARILREALRQRGFENVVDVSVQAGGPVPPVTRHKPAALVLWLRDPPLADLQRHDGAERIYLSSTLALAALGDATLPPGGRVRLIHPFDLPQNWDKRLARARAWMDSQGIEPGDARVQADAYFAATTAAEAVRHLIDNFSRDYFIERIEHMLESPITTSVYPRVALGPGQRYASKGCYVAELSDTPGNLLPLSGWIVP